jgi:hypothetical protein
MKTAYILLLALTLLACSKDNKYSRKLEGDWKLVKKEVAGQEVSLAGISIVLEFGDCSRMNSSCRGVYREKLAQANNTSTTVVLDIETTFSNKGQVLTIDYDYGENLEIYDVIEMSKKELVIRFQGSENVYYFDAF